MKASIRETEIFFDVDGVGLAPHGDTMRERPTAFIVHGGPGIDHSDAKLSCAALTARMQLVFFDQRGHGRSARGDPARFTLDEHVEDLESLRRYLGLSPIVSIGASYGAMVSMAHAARYPDAVSHLVLVSTAAHSGYLEAARKTVAERGTPEQVALYQEMLGGALATEVKLRGYFQAMGPLYAHGQSLPAISTRSILSPDAFNQAYAPGGFLRTFDLRPELGAIKAHTLIIAGRHDWICPPRFAIEIHERISGSELRIFEQSGHYVRADELQPFIDAVLGFLVYRQSRPHA